MWKAFEEMEALGWVEPGKRPKMYALQASGCAPIATRLRRSTSPPASSSRTPPPSPPASASPSPTATPSSSTSSRESGGKAIAATDEAILASILDWAKHEGIFLSPEGAAATAAYDQLIATGDLKPTDKVVLFNTGAGLKYTDMTAEAMHLTPPRQKPRSPPASP